MTMCFNLNHYICIASAGRAMSTAGYSLLLHNLQPVAFSFDVLWIFPLEFSKFTPPSQCHGSRKEAPGIGGTQTQSQKSAVFSGVEKQHSQWSLSCALSAWKWGAISLQFRVQSEGNRAAQGGERKGEERERKTEEIAIGGNGRYRDGWRKGQRKATPRRGRWHSASLGVTVSLCYTSPRLCPNFRKKPWLCLNFRKKPWLSNAY